MATYTLSVSLGASSSMSDNGRLTMSPQTALGAAGVVSDHGLSLSLDMVRIVRELLQQASVTAEMLKSAGISGERLL